MSQGKKPGPALLELLERDRQFTKMAVKVYGRRRGKQEAQRILMRHERDIRETQQIFSQVLSAIGRAIFAAANRGK